MQEIDKKIINLLLKDGRIKYREIANKLNISTSTAFNKLKKLSDNSTIERVVPVINDKITQLSYEVIISILVKAGHLSDVEKEIAHLKNVCAVYDVTGEWDAIIIAKFKTREEMDSFVKKLRKVPNVIRTNTSFVLNKVKEDFVFGGF